MTSSQMTRLLLTRKMTGKHHRMRDLRLTCQMRTRHVMVFLEWVQQLLEQQRQHFLIPRKQHLRLLLETVVKAVAVKRRKMLLLSVTKKNISLLTVNLTMKSNLRLNLKIATHHPPLMSKIPMLTLPTPLGMTHHPTMCPEETTQTKTRLHHPLTPILRCQVSSRKQTDWIPAMDHPRQITVIFRVCLHLQKAARMPLAQPVMVQEQQQEQQEQQDHLSVLLTTP